MFAGDRRGSHRLHFTASRVLDLASGSGWLTDSPIKDKIVVLGGTYDPRDEHQTPLGWMNGVEILAYETETELHGGGQPPAGVMLVILLGGVVGLIILLLFQHFSPTKAVLLSLLTIPIVAVSASLIAFRSVAFWAFFVTVPFAVLVQEIYSHVKDYRMKLVTRLYQSALRNRTERTSSTQPTEPKEIDTGTAKITEAETAPR